MKFVTYILINRNKLKTYVGHTRNLENRIKEHNNGETNFTRRFKPWEVLYSIEFTTEIESIAKEKYFKSAAGRRWIKKNLFS